MDTEEQYLSAYCPFLQFCIHDLFTPMASKFLCDYVEKDILILQLLPRNLRRADNRFTLTERARLQASFEKTWDVALALANPGSAASAEKSLCEIELKEHLRLREMALLVACYTDAAAREKLDSMLPQNDYNKEAMDKALLKIVSTFIDRLSIERYGRLNIPEGAPLDFFTFFDMWQDEVDDYISLRPAKQ